ncbi:MAG: hypothetical protein RLZZ397_993 [Pseudomonadota bacterium]|jgi:DNA-binding MarR family transcriptional regulator
MAKTLSSNSASAVYMRFLRLVKALEGSGEAPQLDANESALLNALAERWHAGHPMTIMQAMALSDLGSPATLHRRIMRLRQLGMIDAVEDKSDTRIRHLVLTASAVDYFEKLSKTLRSAVSATV